MEHCSVLTKDCPEVLTFLQAKFSKASPDFLSSVEFRNTVGRCLTRAQANRSKTFVYINELCTVLRQHAAKRRQTTTKVEPGPCTSTSNCLQSTSASFQNTNQTKDKTDEDGDVGKVASDDKQPSTSGLQDGAGDDNQEGQDAERRAKRASKKQVGVMITVKLRRNQWLLRPKLLLFLQNDGFYQMKEEGKSGITPFELPNFLDLSF